MNFKRCSFLVPSVNLMLCKLCLLSFVSQGQSGKTEKDKYIQATHVQAIEGKTAQLSFPLTASARDKIYMVLWFRDDAGIPLYSFDVREKPLSQANHWSDPEVFGTRATFITNSNLLYLELRDVKRHDQGLYRCRVDIKNSQTQNFRFNLTVIIPPDQPIVLDRWGRELNSTIIGPKEEGDDVVLVCRVIGGRPPPKVRWLVNGVIVDDQFEKNSGYVIENRLLWPSVQRRDLQSVFSCQTSNTDLIPPKESTHLLDIYLKPISVTILNATEFLVADKKYEIICQSIGSRPKALITWYKAKKILKRSREWTIDNSSISELSFVPAVEDDGKYLTCKAENPRITGLYLEATKKLNVQYPPIVTLSLGSTLSAEDIKENDDVYFECAIQANPQWRKLQWYHNGVPLVHNTSAKVIRSNQSLVLQKVNKHSIGTYECSALNSEGETVSNQLSLRIKFIPYCVTDKMVIVGAAKGERIKLSCYIVTDPKAKKFFWKFENTEESVFLEPDLFTNSGNLSEMFYTPVLEQDFGTLSCWAANDVGTQVDSCIFQLILAGSPSPVYNCTWNNQTQYKLSIKCQPGYDGGLPQIFVLDIISSYDKISRYNITNTGEPYFEILNFHNLTQNLSVSIAPTDALKIFIYSVNQKGQSSAFFMSEIYVKGHHLKTDLSPSWSPILIGSILILLFLFFIVAFKIFFKFRKQSRNYSHTDDMSKESKSSLLSHEKTTKRISPRWQRIDNNAKRKVEYNSTDDERDPDIIPYPRFLSSAVQQEELIPMTNEEISLQDNLNHIIFTDNASDTEINFSGINDLLMTTRVPESCV